ncbi:TIGR03067 domain-containing protein [Paludisphaera borealis]|uniref:TIGR03067 domain-containing protein n=1 Tax=Paludisphaera borealis TaxID=1387353 RepID=A0A1U7CUW9_9BACT|nr:TIGR03067 domain-containing protein [Paludisphaera borealis]APW62673.1 hypothetical protein BSF38_04223 [Paludisphaera borealis]
MMGLLLTLLGIVLIQDDVKPTATELRRAHQMLAGPWTVASATDDGDTVGADILRRKMVKDGRVVIKNRTITHVNPETGETLVNAFTINPAKLPREINLISIDDRTLPGIFKFEGDELVICFTDGQRPERPTDFESKPGSSRVVLRLKTAADKKATVQPDVEVDDVVETKEVPASTVSPLRSAGAPKATEAELRRDRDLLGGLWRILSIQDDGETLGTELIRQKIAENGLLRVGSRGVSVVSPTDEQKRLWAYRIDPATSPKEIDLITQFDTILKGIYTFEGDQLVVCTTKSEDEPRPMVFEAPVGSRRVLYTLKTVKPEPAAARPAAPPQPTPEEQARLREQKIRDMIVGSWSMTDSRGSLVTVFRADGTFSSTRTLSRKRLFEPGSKSFNGAWTFGQSRLTARVSGTTDPNLLGYSYTGRIQSIGEDTMVAADLNGGLRTFRKLR